MEKQKLVIACPVYNDIEGLKYAFYSLLNSTLVRDKILFVVSDSPDGSDKFCDELAKFYKFVEVIHTPKKGPMDAYQKIFKYAKENKSDLFLFQTDVIFPRKFNCDWLVEMKRISNEREDCGIVTCYGGGGQSGPDFIKDFHWVGAWCTYISYRAIEKLGGYDENIPLGWGCDIDYTYAIEQNGLRVYVIDYWVNHTPNYVAGHEHEKVSNIQELRTKAYEYMRKKWKVGEYNEKN